MLGLFSDEVVLFKVSRFFLVSTKKPEISIRMWSSNIHVSIDALLQTYDHSNCFRYYRYTNKSRNFLFFPFMDFQFSF